MSFREMEEAVAKAEMANPTGLQLNRTTASQIARGVYKGTPESGTIRAIALVAGVPEHVAFAAVGQRVTGTPFRDELPDGVDQLEPRERRAALDLLRVLIAQRQELNRYADEPREQHAPSAEAASPEEQALESQKTAAAVVGRNDSAAFGVVPDLDLDASGAGDVTRGARDFKRTVETLIATANGILRDAAEAPPVVVVPPQKPGRPSVTEYADLVVHLVGLLTTHLRTVNAAVDTTGEAVLDIAKGMNRGDQPAINEAVHRFHYEFGIMLAAQGSAVEVLNELLVLTPVELLAQLESQPTHAYDAYSEFIRDALVKGNEKHPIVGPLLALADTSERVQRELRGWRAQVDSLLEPGGDTSPERELAREMGRRLRTTRSPNRAAESTESEIDTQLSRVDLAFSPEIFREAVWPDRSPVAHAEMDRFVSWVAAGEPPQFQSYRQGDYDLVARRVPGPTDAEREHGAQDRDAEAPDAEGPEAGA